MLSIAEVVQNGMCIGCGLCESVTEGRVTMSMTDAGGHRPSSTDFSEEEETVLLASCPGNVVRARTDGAETHVDLVWGAHRSMFMAWAGDADVRFKSATGGVLTALAQHGVESGMASFVLHAKADPEAPMRTVWTMSETAAEVLDASGSRYGPASVLSGMHRALDRGEPFVVVAKPCDLNAVHGLAQVDSRVDELVVARMVMVCGGTSRLTKSQAVLDELAVHETNVTLFRYRGHGNPGPTRIESSDRVVHERSYLDMWADEGGWDLETRCKFCPDALGEAADIAAADAWPGGAPTGDDEGFNATVVRTMAGERLVASAIAAGALVRGEEISAAQFNDFQPHQVRKKQALAARFTGLRDADVTVLQTEGLRIEELGAALDPTSFDKERSGSATRAKAGRFSE
ncbi:MAG: coenzyme F420 hydrogenase subunit beta [Verrucomicrobiales bacterium]|jgi:coenzyme F420 hydrogenase subunit beta